MESNAPDAWQVTVNGEPHSLSGEITVAGLLERLDITESRGVAVAVDGAVVPRSAWAATALHDGARVEVIRAVQGG